MADILPFRALEYSRDRVRLDHVTTQPYDKISPEMEQRYLDRHPNSVVRLIRPHSNPSPDPKVTDYVHAARTLSAWREQGVLTQVREPILYAYFQKFRLPGSDRLRTRKGVICLTRLEEYAKRVIFPHERTLSGPRADRLDLLRATRTHFGQVFLLYSDPENRVDAVLDRVGATPSEVSVRDEFDVDHELWKITESRSIGAIRRELADKSLVIADGHHRYETALAFRDEMRRERNSDDGGAYDWLMTTLVNMDSPDMTILPTHRLLSGFDRLTLPEMLNALGTSFDVESIDSRDGLALSLETAGAVRPTIGMAAGDSGGLYRLTLKEGAESQLSELSSRQATLDVAILHGLILGQCLGISEDEVRSENYLRYVRGFTEAIDQVRSGRAQVAFLLNPTRLDQVRDVALAGEVLPQKSTDFFPKLLSGLAMYSMD
jgi:uncharacterized protein (DUF1015 family)